MPSAVRVGLIQAYNNDYPSIKDILGKLDQVVTRLNIKDFSKQNNTSSSYSSGLESNASNISEIPTINIGLSTPDQSATYCLEFFSFFARENQAGGANENSWFLFYRYTKLKK